MNDVISVMVSLLFVTIFPLFQ